MKGYPTLLEGFRLAVERGLVGTLELRGPQLTEAERRHHTELEHVIERAPALVERVRLAGPVPYDAIPACSFAKRRLLSGTHARDSETFDKVVCEAGACGVRSSRTTVSSTSCWPNCRSIALPCRRRRAWLGGCWSSLRPGPSGAPWPGELRRRVVAGHSVESWSRRIAEIVADPTRE